MFSVIITPIAKSHIKEAYSFYKSKASLKVTAKFKSELENTIKALEINPFYEFRSNNFRAIPLKKFPYLVFFELNEKRN